MIMDVKVVVALRVLLIGQATLAKIIVISTPPSLIDAPMTPLRNLQMHD